MHVPHHKTQFKKHSEHQEEQQHCCPQEESHHEVPYQSEDKHKSSDDEHYVEKSDNHTEHHEEQDHIQEHNDDQEHHDVKEQEQPSVHQHKMPKTYSMIEWNPAYEDPPNTGSLGADIPDLSEFKNVWDQSYIQQQQYIWVAPVHQPEPQIMTKPEYAHYNTDDYNPEHLYPRQLTQEDDEYEDDEDDEYNEEPQSSEEDDQQYEQYREEHHHQKEQQQHHHHQPQVWHPPSFPWDSVPNHFPTPTRVWLPLDQQRQWPEDKSCKYLYFRWLYLCCTKKKVSYSLFLSKIRFKS